MRVADGDVRATRITREAYNVFLHDLRAPTDAEGQTVRVGRQAHVLAVASSDGQEDVVISVGDVAPRERDRAALEG